MNFSLLRGISNKGLASFLSASPLSGVRAASSPDRRVEETHTSSTGKPGVPSSLHAFIITKDEEPNINRVLDKLTWVEKVVVLDSYSTDNTINILQSYPNVELAYRQFDTFAKQCNHGLSTISSEWVLALDADYLVTDEFIEETKAILAENDQSIVAYQVKFEFLVNGKQLLSNNTTPREVLFRRSLGSYQDDGHAHRLVITGKIKSYKAKILHDDRKSLSRWLKNQDAYSIREYYKLLDSTHKPNSSFVIKIRKTKILAPFIVFFYCLFVKGLIFDGWAGWHYTLQRTLVEILFALRLIEEEKFNK